MSSYNLIDEIFSQFEETVLSNSSVSKKASQSTVYQKAKTSSVKVTQPYVTQIVEKTNYKSRYSHFVKCLSSIVFENYPEDKKDGYVSAINRYMELADQNRTNLKLLEEQVGKDLEETAKKMDNNFVAGYCDALILIRKVLNQSKISRFQELAIKIN